MKKKITRIVAVVTSMALLASGTQVSAKKSLPLSFKRATISIKEGSSKKLTFSKKTKKKIKKIVKWKSADKKIAKVNSKGKVRGIKEGKTNISAVVKLKNGKKYTVTCKVKVVADIAPTNQVSPVPTATIVPTGIPTSSAVTVNTEAPVSAEKPNNTELPVNSESPKSDVSITGKLESYLLEDYLDDDINAIIRSKSELDAYIQNTLADVAAVTLEEIEKAFTDYNEEYFTKKALVVGVHGFGRGYEESIGKMFIPGTEWNKLMITINMEYVVPSDQMVTDDIVTYLSIIEVEQTTISGVTETVYDYPMIQSVSGSSIKGCILSGNVSEDVNAIIRTKEEMDSFVTEAFAQASEAEVSEIETLLKDYNEDFFEEKALCIGGYDFGRGYKQSLRGIYTPINTPEKLNITIGMEYNVPEDQMVLADIVKYISIIEVDQKDIANVTEVTFNHFVW